MAQCLNELRQLIKNKRVLHWFSKCGSRENSSKIIKSLLAFFKCEIQFAETFTFA